MSLKKKITHALISVSEKTGIVKFAKALSNAGIKLLSTGGTASLLRENNIPVTDVSDITGFPEMMGGRVKTLHPKLYGGILARANDSNVLAEFEIPLIGLVVVNLYPFEKTISQKNCSLEEAIENIDIGGPSLLRAAAKNFYETTAIVDSEDYKIVLKEIEKQGETSLETRLRLAKKVFAHVTQYDAAISNYFSRIETDSEHKKFPDVYSLQLQKKIDLRYGENPHQSAAFYVDNSHPERASISSATQLSGKPLSYNNIADADAAIECVKQFKKLGCVIVKHANPCAVSLGSSQLDAYTKAFNADSTSAFGGIIAFNSLLEAETIKRILAQQFVEVIIAPSITPEALDVVNQKPNIRILTVGDLNHIPEKHYEYKSVTGGMLIQERDNLPTPPNLDIVTKRKPSTEEMDDLLFAWQVVRFIKSNAVVYAKNELTLGIGAGQMSRVFSSKIAALKAEQASLSLKGSVMASDAFFPFRDSIDEAAQREISAIIQPGGSIKDQEVIQAADEHNIAMIFTHRRHFRH